MEIDNKSGFKNFFADFSYENSKDKSKDSSISHIIVANANEPILHEHYNKNAIEYLKSILRS